MRKRERTLDELRAELDKHKNIGARTRWCSCGHRVAIHRKYDICTQYDCSCLKSAWFASLCGYFYTKKMWRIEDLEAEIARREAEGPQDAVVYDLDQKRNGTLNPGL